MSKIRKALLAGLGAAAAAVTAGLANGGDLNWGLVAGAAGAALLAGLGVYTVPNVPAR
jgi:hypothetical protein